MRIATTPDASTVKWIGAMMCPRKINLLQRLSRAIVVQYVTYASDVSRVGCVWHERTLLQFTEYVGPSYHHPGDLSGTIAASRVRLMFLYACFGTSICSIQRILRMSFWGERSILSTKEDIMGWGYTNTLHWQSLWACHPVLSPGAGYFFSVTWLKCRVNTSDVFIAAFLIPIPW